MISKERQTTLIFCGETRPFHNCIKRCETDHRSNENKVLSNVTARGGGLAPTLGLRTCMMVKRSFVALLLIQMNYASWN